LAPKVPYVAAHSARLAPKESYVDDLRAELAAVADPGKAPGMSRREALKNIG
jgi:hypothetical protein